MGGKILGETEHARVGEQVEICEGFRVNRTVNLSATQVGRPANNSLKFSNLLLKDYSLPDQQLA
jgi:hypothetical protein